MRIAATIVLVLMLALPVIADEVPENGIDWVKSFEKGLAQAKKTNRHLLVDFYTPT